MARRLEEIVAHLKEKSGVVMVQDGEIDGYVHWFVREDFAGAEAPRPVLAWDSTDGFLACTEYPDPLPETGDVVEAIRFVAGYQGRGVFIFDGRGLDLDSQLAALRKPLRQLAMKLPDGRDLAVIIVVDRPVCSALAELATWIGDPPVPGPAPPRRKPAAVDKFREIYDLDRFDTTDWEVRLEQMGPEDVEGVLASGAWEASLERVNNLRAALKKRFARKDAILDALCAATVAQVPAVLIGPPGTAKSNMVRCLCEGLGLTARQAPGGNGKPGGRKYFEYLLTRYTTPEEIFGPIHVQELIDRQVYRRVTEGYLPEAQIAFLDEIFKASSAILNTLLTILNERVFYNAGQTVRVPW